MQLTLTILIVAAAVAIAARKAWRKWTGKSSSCDTCAQGCGSCQLKEMCQKKEKGA